MSACPTASREKTAGFPPPAVCLLDTEEMPKKKLSFTAICNEEIIRLSSWVYIEFPFIKWWENNKEALCWGDSWEEGGTLLRRQLGGQTAEEKA